MPNSAESNELLEIQTAPREPRPLRNRYAGSVTTWHSEPNTRSAPAV